MRKHRRRFIKQLAGSLAGGLLFNTWPLEAKSELIQHGDVYDEAYWKMVRQQFPLNRDRIFLNNGTMGPSPYYVLDRVREEMYEVEKNMHYGGWRHAAKKIASFINAQPQEIALTHNVTEGINIVCWGLPLKKGDEVILTTHEHVGNALPWLNRAKVDGIVVKALDPAFTADETLNRLNDLITPKTKVVAIPHIPCTQGQIMPVKEISALAKSKGLFVFYDGAHGPGMLNLDMKDIGCDFYASCAHKWLLGPKGTGFLYTSEEMRDLLQPYYVGGGSDTGWDMLSDHPHLDGYVDNGHRFYFGTQNLALYRGLEAAIEFMENIGMDHVEQRSRGMAKYFQDRLLELEGQIEMLTPTEDRSRSAVIGFRIKNMDYLKFYDVAQEHKIKIRVVSENKLNLIRVSTHIYNNQDEVDQLLALIKSVA